MSEILERLTTVLSDRYRIESELGAGGMATVYLAEDLKHDRKVALKVLRPELTAVLGGERFLNEIRLTANLQHPHILPLFDSGEAAGLLYYVMPYIEGESLRELLDRERELSVEDAVRITEQVAGALDYAHRHEVIHRDIKPENILLHDGQALVADFGIALAVRAAGGDRLTQTGLSLGTPQYMSPEQATVDRELDARSDIYSLGAVAYEMLAGEPPYTGPSTQAIIAKIVTEEPRPLGQQRRSVPPHVAGTIHKALEKLPADRFNTAAELADAFHRPGMVTAPSAAAIAPGRPGAGPIARLAWPAATLAALGLAALSWMRTSGANADDPVVRFLVSLPSGEQLGEAPGHLLSVAPDGTGFVYVGVGPEGRRLYFRPFDRFEAVPIPGTEDANRPFFSPDSRWVGFSADGQLKKVSLDGGSPIRISDGSMLGASWGTDGTIVFSPSSRGGLSRVSADGGEVSSLTTVDSVAGEVDHVTPHLLPDGKTVLYSTWTANTSRITAADLETGEKSHLMEGSDAQYSESGHIVYSSDDGLLAVPFDARRLELTGPAVPVDAPRVGLSRAGVADFGLTQNGTLVFLRGDDASDRALVLVDREGREQELSSELRAYDGPRFSPDGRRIALRIQDNGFHIWIFEMRRSTFSRLTFEPANYYPEWTADGSRVAFVGNRGDETDLYWRSADGSGSAETLLQAPHSQWEVAWAPTDDYLVYRQNSPESGRDLWLMPLAGDREPRPLVASSDQERSPRISNDGRYVAYVSDESGQSEVYVQTLDGAGKWQISTHGGTEPLWSHDDAELFYRSGNHIVAVAVETQPVFSTGPAEILFEGPYVPNPHHTNYDIHPDGDRLVMVRSALGERQVVVVLNWVRELAAVN